MTIINKIEEQKQEMDFYKNLAATAAKSGNYSGMNEMSLLNIMLSAKDFGVSPMKAINGSFYVVNGKISMSTALMTDRIRKEGHSVKIPEWTDQKCVLIGVRKDNGDSVKFEFTMDDAAKAGLLNSPTWKKYPKQMLYNRAMSTLARVLFPDIVGNCYSEDEREELKTPFKPVNTQDPQVIEVPSQVEEDSLTEEQCAQLDAILSGEDEIREKLCNHLKIKTIYEVKPKDFDRAVKSILKKISERETENE
jgi:hypothetical protein